MTRPTPYNVPKEPIHAATDLRCEPYDFDKIVPMSLLRQHTNTDDVEHFDDNLLGFYRRAALSAAQRYTGLLLTGRKTMNEIVRMPDIAQLSRQSYESYSGIGYDEAIAHVQTQRPTILYRVKHAFATEQAFYQAPGLGQSEMLVVEPGSREVTLNVRRQPFFGIGDGSSCCNPCGTDGQQVNRLMYVAGFANECDIPPEVALGAMKYVAHVIENAGDMPMVTTAQGNTGPNTVRLGEANDPAIASGAVDIWSTIITDAF